jgi:hypothetical protein
MIKHRFCNCEDRPCCGCDNGSFEVFEDRWTDETERFPNEEDEENYGGEDSYLDSEFESRYEIDFGE